MISGSISIAIDLGETRQGWKEQLGTAIDLLIRQTFMEFLLCARHCAKCCEHIKAEMTKTWLQGAYSQLEIRP